jgi:hypothetical protein
VHPLLSLERRAGGGEMAGSVAGLLCNIEGHACRLVMNH